MDDTSLDMDLKDRSSYSNYINNFVFANLLGFYSFGMPGFIMFVATCVIICLGLPLTLGSIYGLCSQVRNGEVASIYVINLLISDLVQFCCLVVEVALSEDLMVFLENWEIFWVFTYIYDYSLLVSVGLMVCIALERYLLIVHPLWYRCRRTIKTSVMICVPVWILPSVCLLTFRFSEQYIFIVISTIFFLLPLPLLLFFLVATLKALSASISVPTDEKRRIAGMLIVVLLIYLLLFLPGIIMFVLWHNDVNNTNADLNPHLFLLLDLAPMFFKLSPLADLVLYIILRKGTIRQLSVCVCRCRKQSNEISAVPV